MKFFENAQSDDLITVTIEDDFERPDEANEILARLSARFDNKENDDTFELTIDEFKSFLDNNDYDIELFKIYQDGDIIYDKYALIYDADVDYSE